MSKHDMKTPHKSKDADEFTDAIGSLRYSVSFVAANLNEYHGRLRSFLPVVAKHDLCDHDALPDLYGAAVSLLYTIEEQMERLASDLAAIDLHLVSLRGENHGKK